MLYELAATGTPSVSIATEPHEIFNIKYWSAKGTTVSLGWENVLENKNISETISGLLTNRNMRCEMSKTGMRLIDTKGLTRVLDVVEKIL